MKRPKRIPDPEIDAIAQCAYQLAKLRRVPGHRWMRSLNRSEINRVLDYLKAKFN